MPATLAQRFKAEVRRSPQKAAVLAVLLAVALWYWAPLLSRLVAGKPGDKLPTAAELTASVAPLAIQPDPAANLPTVAAMAPAAASWEGLLEQIAADERMRSAATLPVARDPFRPIAAATAPPLETIASEQTSDSPQPSAEEDAPALDRKPVMLPLTAIILGRLRRSALIGGRAYQQGEVCSAQGMEFRIVSIDRDHIVLERLADGYRFEQSLPRHEQSPHLEIRRAQ